MENRNKNHFFHMQGAVPARPNPQKAKVRAKAVARTGEVK